MCLISILFGEHAARSEENLRGVHEGRHSAYFSLEWRFRSGSCFYSAGLSSGCPTLLRRTIRRASSTGEPPDLTRYILQCEHSPEKELSRCDASFSDEVSSSTAAWSETVSIVPEELLEI